MATIHSRDRDHGATGKGCVGEGRRGEGADLDQLLDQRGAKPVARLQPTTGVMSHIFTTRSVPQVTISPRAMSMDMWEMLCFPSWKVAREVRSSSLMES